MLYNLVNDIYKVNPVVHKRLLELNGFQYGAIDKPPINTISLSELKKTVKLRPGNSYLVKVKVKELFSDSDYNRPDELNIEKIFEALKKSKGFSWRHSNVLVASLRPDGKLVLTQGNHRSLMALIALGLEAEVLVCIHVHQDSLEENLREMYRIESDDFNTDALIRETMKSNQKFKGAYVAGEQWAIDIYKFLAEFKISVANTNKISVGPCETFKSKKTFQAYPRFQEAEKIDTTPNKYFLRSALSSLVKSLPENDINGAAFCALVIFLRDFNTRLELFEGKGYTLDDFLYFV